MPHKARKRFGQHFLHDASVLSKIVAALPQKPNQHLVEIGPGQGALTSLLLDHCRHLDVIEIDRDLVKILEERYAHHEKITIHSADALSFDYSSLAQREEKFTLVGNLPYNISTPLLFHLFEYKSVIDEMLFMLQKEVVDRLSAVPGNKRYGRLSVMAQYHCRIEKCFSVSPGSFNPPPKVTSAVVKLVPYAAPPVSVADHAVFTQVVSAAFGQRRKTLRNALKKLLSAEEIASAGIDPKARAETLTLEDFANLTRILQRPDSG